MSISRASTNRKPKKPGPLDEAALYEYAIRTLGRRMRTVTELKRLMQTRVEPGEAGEAKVSAVVLRLKEQRYLDDTAYAATYSRLRQENQKFGQRRVRQELGRKGVAAELIAKTLDTSYENVSEEDLAQQHLARKRVSPPKNEKESARVVGQLVRAGFSTSVIFKILKDWQVSDETLSALETIDTNGDADS